MENIRTFACKVCGWRMKSEVRPAPLKWDDGHQCYFRRVQTRPSPSYFLSAKTPPPDTIWLDKDGQPDTENYYRLRAWVGHWNSLALEKIPEFLEKAHRLLEKAEARADDDQIAVAKVGYAGDEFYFARAEKECPISLETDKESIPAFVFRGQWKFNPRLDQKQRDYLLDCVVADLIGEAGKVAY